VTQTPDKNTSRVYGAYNEMLATGDLLALILERVLNLLANFHINSRVYRGTGKVKMKLPKCLLHAMPLRLQELEVSSTHSKPLQWVEVKGQIHTSFSVPKVFIAR
jgi:hypothetical protein